MVVLLEIWDYFSIGLGWVFVGLPKIRVATDSGSSLLWHSSIYTVRLWRCVWYFIKYLDEISTGLISVEFDSFGISNSCDVVVTFSSTTIYFGYKFSDRPAIGSDNKQSEIIRNFCFIVMHRSSIIRSTLCFRLPLQSTFLLALCVPDSNFFIFLNCKCRRTYQLCNLC